jgi:hypothetical protein
MPAKREELIRNKLPDVGLSICDEWSILVILCHSLYVKWNNGIFGS